jgi:hypothetical protein
MSVVEVVRVDAGDGGAVVLLLSDLLDRLVLLLDQVLQVSLFLDQTLYVVALPHQCVSQLMVLLNIVSADLLYLSKLFLSWTINITLNVSIGHHRFSLQPSHSFK